MWFAVFPQLNFKHKTQTKEKIYSKNCKEPNKKQTNHIRILSSPLGFNPLSL